MHRDEEAKEGSGEDVEGTGGDEEMKRGKGALTLSEGRVVEDGLVYEDLKSEQTLASRDLILPSLSLDLVGDLLTIPIVAKVFTTIQNVNRARLLRMACFALALDTTGASSTSSLFNFPSESILSKSVLVELPPSLLPSTDSPGSRSRFFNSVCFSESLREVSIVTGNGGVTQDKREGVTARGWDEVKIVLTCHDSY